MEAPVFRAAAEAEEGEDENISLETAAETVGQDVMEKIRDTSMGIYEKGREYALGRGIIIADTKFEFGWNKNRDIVLIDEVLTPESSRCWPANDWAPGREQNSFAKQYVRN